MEQREDDRPPGGRRRRRRASASATRTGAGRVEPTGQARRARPPAPAAAPAAIAHWPSVEMPIGVIRYFVGSTARSTWAAVVHDTSCSADWPPKITTRLIRSSVIDVVAVPSWSIGRTVPFDLVRILASEAAAAVGGQPDRTGRRVRRRVVRLTLDRARANCSCRSSPNATATTSSARRSPPERSRSSRASRTSSAATARRSRSPTRRPR